MKQQKDKQKKKIKIESDVKEIACNLMPSILGETKKEEEEKIGFKRLRQCAARSKHTNFNSSKTRIQIGY